MIGITPELQQAVLDCLKMAAETYKKINEIRQIQ